MIRLILLSDFTESFSYNLLKGVLMYANSHEPWVVCRMPLSYKQTYGIKGVLKWAKTWHADAIIGRFDNDDNVEIFRENGIIAIAQDYKARFSNIPNITGDYYKTGRMAAEFFLRKGYQNFAFYGYRDTVWSQERCEGFYKCIAEHGFGNCFQSYQEQSLDDLWFYERYLPAQISDTGRAFVVLRVTVARRTAFDYVCDIDAAARKTDLPQHTF